jgi:catechol 2,3-dioxygenase-like lactoylglutathione lyase family enzyme
VNRALPLLSSADLQATLAFYERLGFRSKGAPPEEWDYLIVDADGIELHFVGPVVDERSPGSCFVYVDDIDAVYARWHQAAGDDARFVPLRHTNYGMRAFTMFDPDGNEVRVGTPARPR